MSPQWHGKRCKECGGWPAEVGLISGTGLCHGCAQERMLTNNEAISEHKGPAFDHWRRKTLAAFGVTLPEDDRRTA